MKNEIMKSFASCVVIGIFVVLAASILSLWLDKSFKETLLFLMSPGRNIVEKGTGPDKKNRGETFGTVDNSKKKSMEEWVDSTDINR